VREQPSNDQKQSANKKKWRSRPWFWWALYGALVLTGMVIGSYYFKNGADRAKFWVEGLLSAGVLSVVIIQAVIYRKQWQVMDRSLVIGTRAYVGLHSIDFDTGNRRLLIQIENIGRVPADDIVISLRMEYGVPEKFKPFVDRYTELSADKTEIVFNLRFVYRYGKYKLFPGNFKIPILIRFERDRILTPDEFQLITNGAARLTIFGNINFSDGFNSGKNTDFAVRYYLEGKAWIPQYVPSPRELKKDANSRSSDWKA
jgi:hypothetical protein